MSELRTVVSGMVDCPHDHSRKKWIVPGPNSSTLICADCEHERITVMIERDRTSALRNAFASLGDAIRFQVNLACYAPWCGCEIARDAEDPFVCETARMVYEKVPEVFAHGTRRGGSER